VLVEDCESSGNELDGFTLDMQNNCTFRRNYSHDNDRHGINLVSTTAGVTLTDNRSLRNGATGLMAQNGTHEVVIQACELAENALQGMFLRDADGCTLLGNTFRNNRRSGLLLRLSDNTSITGNTFTENDTGSVGRAVVTIDSSTANIVASNTITSIKARQGVLESGTSDFTQVNQNIITVTTQHVVLIGAHSSQSGNQLHVP
jgi:parallel beta-helix repeat protein